MSICKGKPATLPSLDTIGLIPVDQASLSITQGGSGTSSSAIPPLRQASIGLGFSPSTLGRGTSSLNPVDIFPTVTTSKLNSEKVDEKEKARSKEKEEETLKREKEEAARKEKKAEKKKRKEEEAVKERLRNEEEVKEQARLKKREDRRLRKLANEHEAQRQKEEEENTQAMSAKKAKKNAQARKQPPPAPNLICRTAKPCSRARKMDYHLTSPHQYLLPRMGDLASNVKSPRLLTSLSRV